MKKEELLRLYEEMMAGQVDRKAAMVGIDMLMQQAEPGMAATIFYCAAVRWFDTATIEFMRQGAPATGLSTEAILTEMISYPFTRSHPVQGYTFHEDVRDHILAKLRSEDVALFQDIQQRAIVLYDHRIAQLSDKDKEDLSEAWQMFQLEKLYHTYCLDEEQFVSLFVRLHGQAIADWEFEFPKSLLAEVEAYELSPQVQHTIKLFKDGIAAIGREQFTQALPMLDFAAASPDVAVEDRAAMLGATAEIYHRMGRDEVAFEKAHTALEIAPNHCWGYASLGDIYKLRGDVDEAIKWYEKATEVDPKEFSPYKDLANLYVDRGEYNKAAQVLHRAIDAGADMKKTYVALSQLYYQMREPEKVREIQDKIVEIDPDEQYDAYVKVGQAYRRVANFSVALSEFQEAIELDPKRHDAYAALANLHEERGQWKDAAAMYTKVGEVAPEQAAAARIKIGQLYLGQDLMAEAEKIFQQTVDECPDRYEGYAGLVSLYEHQRRWDDAIAMHLKVAELNPALARLAWTNAATIYRLQRRFEEARATLDKVIREYPDRPEGYLGLAGLYLKQQQMEKSMEILQGAIRVSPELAYEIRVAVGELHLEQRQFTESKEALQQAISDYPLRYEGYRGLGLLYEQLGQFDQAITMHEKAAQAEPGIAPGAWATIGELYLEQGQLDKAEEMFRQVIEQYPNHAEGYEGLASLYEKHGQLDKAVEMYEKAAEVDPKLAPDTWFGVGDVYLRHGQNEKAEETFRWLVDQYPHRIAGYAGLSKLHTAMGNIQGVTAMQEKIIKIDPSQRYNAHINVGTAYQKAKEYDKAEEEFEQAVEIDPQRHEGYFSLGKLYEEQRELDKAIKMHEKMTEVNPVFAPETWTKIGQLHLEQERFHKAKEMFQQVIEKYPVRYEGYYGLAELYEKQGQLDKAIQMHKKVTEVNPTLRPGAWTTIGQLHMEQDQFDKAEEVFRQVIEQYPNRVEGYTGLASLHEKQDELQKAIEIYERLVEVDPTPAPRAWTKIGQLHMEQGQFDKAEEMFCQVIEQYPNRAEGYTWLAHLHDEQGQLEKAIEMHRKVVEVNPTLAPHAWGRIGRLCSKQGLPTDARQAWLQALSLLDEGKRHDHDALRWRGLTYYRLGEYAKAIGALESAISANPNESRTRFYLALSLLCQGDVDRGQEEYHEGIGLVKDKGDFVTAIEELEDLVDKRPETRGAKEMLEALLEARDKIGR